MTVPRHRWEKRGSDGSNLAILIPQWALNPALGCKPLLGLPCQTGAPGHRASSPALGHGRYSAPQPPSNTRVSYFPFIQDSKGSSEARQLPVLRHEVGSSDFKTCVRTMLPLLAMGPGASYS